MERPNWHAEPVFWSSIFPEVHIVSFLSFKGHSIYGVTPSPPGIVLECVVKFLQVFFPGWFSQGGGHRGSVPSFLLHYIFLLLVYSAQLCH